MDEDDFTWLNERINIVNNDNYDIYFKRNGFELQLSYDNEVKCYSIIVYEWENSTWEVLGEEYDTTTYFDSLHECIRDILDKNGVSYSRLHIRDFHKCKT